MRLLMAAAYVDADSDGVESVGFLDVVGSNLGTCQ